MNGSNVSVIENDVNSLRTRMESPVDFKKKLLGGFDEEDVIKYFKGIDEQLKKTEETFKIRIDEAEDSKRKLKAELESYKDNFGKAVATADELNKVIRSLKEEKLELLGKLKDAEENVSDPHLVRERDTLANRVLELEQEIWQLRKSGKLGDELKASFSEVEEQLRREKAVSAEKEKECFTLRGQLSGVGEQLAELQNKLSEQLTFRTQLEERLDQSNRKIEELKEVQLKLEQRNSSGDNGLTTWVSGIKNDMEILCRQLSDLEEMSNANNQLKQQLMKESARADKAEKELAEFGQLMSEVQNKISAKVLSTIP